MKIRKKSISSVNCNSKYKILDKSGITLISLIIIITLIIILASVTIYAGGSTIQYTKVTKFNSELKIIHARVNELAEENNFDTFGQEISNMNADTQNKINIAMQGASSSGFKYFGKTDLEAINIDNIDRQVIINFSTREVVDINGIEKDGNIMYRLENWENIVYKNTSAGAPSFTLSKKVYGLSADICITNVEYKGNAGKGQISYCLFNNQTEGNWNSVSEEKIRVEQSGVYKVKLTDSAGNTAERTVEVVLTNKPKLDSGMVPVVYDATLGKWKKVSEESGDWYDYASDNKKWANVMLQDGLVVNSDGTINETNMGSMFVWIPRFMYQISEGYHPDEDVEQPIEGNVNIKFLKGTTNIATDGTNVKITNASGQGNWNVHPAFCDGTKNNYANGEWNKEITGFWVAKFQASSSATTSENPQVGESYGGGDTIGTQTVRIAPNVTSWRNISISNINTVCKNMTIINNSYGLTTATNSHLIKNSEWGAIAYLTQSNYGNKQTNADSSSGVWNNSYNNGDGCMTTRTGMVGSSKNDSTQNGTETTVCYEYNTENGQKGSTTRNIYGVYDMSGCAWETVAAYIENGNEKYINCFLEIPNWEKTIYSGGASYNGKKGFQANSGKYGDAVWETSRNDAGTYANAYGWERCFR